jgi:hypothetical protein
LILKNTIIDNMFTYASEAWILTNSDRKQVNIFEMDRACGAYGGGERGSQGVGRET